MLRVIDDNDALRRHFELGVNFIESLVNRHRIEVYILDAEGGSPCHSIASTGMSSRL